MKQEIEVASNFVVGLPNMSQLPPAQRETFRQALIKLMINKFQSHWNVEHPLLGNGFRSIMTCGKFVDPILIQAAAMSGIQKPENLLPTDMVLWVDPFEVSYRIGEYGSTCTLFQDKTNTSKPMHRLSDLSLSKLVVSVN